METLENISNGWGVGDSNWAPLASLTKLIFAKVSNPKEI